MNRIRLLLLLSFLLTGYNSIACDCVTRKWSVNRVYRDIENSDLIFIGNRISYTRAENFEDEEKYSFEVIEVFKGRIEPGDIIYGKIHSPCSGSPNVEGLWVVYARMDEDGLIDYDYTDCGASRSLSGDYLPIPLPLLATEDYIIEKTSRTLPLFLRDWHNGYIILQNFKIRNQSTEMPDSDSQENSVLIYIAIGLAFTALVVALLKK